MPNKSKVKEITKASDLKKIIDEAETILVPTRLYYNDIIYVGVEKEHLFKVLSVVREDKTVIARYTPHIKELVIG